MQDSKCTRHNLLLVFCILHFAFLIASCSLPSLEKPQCTAARDAVKRFYSFHFGNDMHPSQESLKARESFLTPELMKELSASSELANDYFTQTENYPKAFRVGSCTSGSDEKAVLQVLMLWHEERKNEQREVHVEVLKNGDKWRINKVSN